MNALTEWWKNCECPIINGLMFPDGSVESIETMDQPQTAGAHRMLKTVRRQFVDFGPTKVTGVVATCRDEDKERGMVAVGGGAGMGGDGFIAVTDLQDEIMWLAFFDFSNSFVSVKLGETEVIAKSNLGERWHLQLKRPSEIIIEASVE